MAVLLVFLGVMGVGLNRAFERSVLSSAEDALRSQVLLLISAIDVIESNIVAPYVLPEPRLQQPDSNLYAQIYTKAQNSTGTGIVTENVVWRSPSLLERTLPSKNSGLGDFEFYPSQPWQGSRVNTTTLAVEWETEQGTVPFVVQVAETDSVYTRRLARYQRQVGIWLVFFGGALIILLLGILGWSLKPLERVRRQVGEIEEGKRQRFDQDYPTEVNRLTQNLNQLLNFEEQRIERQKEVLGNLAHSLKTPIAVLKGLPYSDAVKADSDEQLVTMQNIIDYQLQSASAVGRRRFSKALDIIESSQQIVRSLDKLHAGKGLKTVLNIAPDTVFFGDQGDWMEVLGNLCDNAFKWSKSRVKVDISQVEQGEAASHKKPIRIVVQDDGPGIDDALRDIILQRGVRLDSQTPGHGLGMHIVKGVVEAYAGSIDIQDSDFDQGTKFTVVLK